MKIIWKCFNGTYEKRKNNLPQGLDIVVSRAEEGYVVDFNKPFVMVFETYNLSDEFLNRINPYGYGIVFVEKEHSFIMPEELSLLKGLATRGLSFFWTMDDIVKHLNFLQRLFQVNMDEFKTLLCEVDRNTHSIKTADLAYLVAKQVGVDDSMAKMIKRAALFHDIGKACLPESFLHAPRWFNPIEKEFVKFHVLYGANLFKFLMQYPSFTKDLSSEEQYLAYRLSLCHHERADGSGYLMGLNGKLHLYIRVVAVADVYEALRSDRSYRSNCDRDLAFSFIKHKEKGFGADVVNALKNLIKNNALDWL